jgi:hypothetical protein
MFDRTKGEKAGKAAIGAISTRTERLVMATSTQSAPAFGDARNITGGAEGLALAANR